MRLAFYSTIPCEPTFGGPLQIHRHFRERNDFDFIDLNPVEMPPWDGWLPRWIVENHLFKRLCNTRLFPWIIYGSYHTLLGRQASKLARHVRESQADAIVTVAYGRRCHVCRIAAKITGVPLITFYHDWWPDLVYTQTPATLRRMDRAFRGLAADSHLILPVTRAILLELGGHRRSKILLPIPADVANRSVAVRQKTDVPENLLVYTGTLQGPYGVMIRDLAFALIAQSRFPWKLRVYGLAGDWPEKDRKELEEAGVYGGLLKQGPDLNAALEAADLLFVVQDFMERNRRRAKTSFPSKILDYLPVCKPILYWGPCDCSAITFANENHMPLQISQPEPSAVMKLLEQYRNSEGLRQEAKAAAELASNMFEAGAIHTLMVDAIRQSLKGESGRSGAQR